MTSWRDRASEQTQTELDTLLQVGLEFAQDRLEAGASFPPAGFTVGTAGIDEGLAMHQLGEVDMSTSEQLAELRRQLHAERNQFSSIAVTADVVRRSDSYDSAIRVELVSLADRVSLYVMLPYRRGRGDVAPEYGAIVATQGDDGFWFGTD